MNIQLLELRFRRPRVLIGALGSIAICFAMASTVRAQTWNVAGGGTWTNADTDFTPTYNNGGPATFSNSAGGTITIDAGGVSPSATNVSATSGTYSFTGGSILSGTLSKTGGGTLVLTGANSFSSTNNQLGIVEVGSDSSLGSGSLGLSAGPSSIVTLRSMDATAHTFTNAVVINHHANFGSASTGDLTFTGTVNKGAAAKILTILNAQTTFTNVISGVGGLVTKAGAGTLVLSGANTYTGGTTISGGIMLANAAVSSTNSSTGTGNVSVAATTTLGGTGQIRPGTGNNINVASGGTLAPGASIGTLTINGAGTAVNVLTMSSGSEFDFELGAAGVSFAAPGSSDQLTISTAVANDVAFNSNNIDFLLTGAYGYYKLFDSDLATAVEGSDAWSGLTLGGGSGRQITSGLNVTNLGAGLTGTLFVGDGAGIGDAGDIYLFVPEPSSFAMLLLGSVILWLVRNKRSS